jgi:hypothetical protein
MRELEGRAEALAVQLNSPPEHDSERERERDVFIWINS